MSKKYQIDLKSGSALTAEGDFNVKDMINAGGRFIAFGDVVVATDQIEAVWPLDEGKEPKEAGHRYETEPAPQ